MTSIFEASITTHPTFHVMKNNRLHTVRDLDLPTLRRISGGTDTSVPDPLGGVVGDLGNGINTGIVVEDMTLI